MELTPEEVEFIADALYSHWHSDYDGEVVDELRPSRELCMKLGIDWRHKCFPRDEMEQSVVDAEREVRFEEARAERQRLQDYYDQNPEELRKAELAGIRAAHEAIKQGWARSAAERHGRVVEQSAMLRNSEESV